MDPAPPAPWDFVIQLYTFHKNLFDKKVESDFCLKILFHAF